jgi:hypothetical protein
MQQLICRLSLRYVEDYPLILKCVESYHERSSVPGYAASVLEHQRLLGILQQQYLNLAVLALSRQHERAFLEIYHITLPGPPESRRRPVSNDSSHKKWFCSANIKLGSEGSDEHESDEHENMKATNTKSPFAKLRWYQTRCQLHW